MAELATGAVNSLLGVIRNEAALLGGVRGDVQFIKEEMESMNSFLLHLARTVPPGGEHDEQVQTWMGQVRILAHDCNNCIDLYLNRRNPDIHLPRGGPLRYLLWALWFLRKVVAQHRAALQLRSLKERARDVGERRLRYSVKVPESAATPVEDKDKDGDDQLAAATMDGGASFVQPYSTLDDYFEAKFVLWITKLLHQREISKGWIPSVSIAVDADLDAGTVAHEALAMVRTENHLKRSVSVDIPSVHLDFQPLRPKEVFYYILRELKLDLLKHANSQTHSDHEEVLGDGEADEPYIELTRKWRIYYEKKEMMEDIKTSIRTTKLNYKIEEIEKELEDVVGDKLLLQSLKEQMKAYNKDKMKSKICKKPLGVLLLLLKSATVATDEKKVRKRDRPTLALWYDDIIEETAKKLRRCMEKVVEGHEDDKNNSDEEEDFDDDSEGDEDYEKGNGGKVVNKHNNGSIILDDGQYENILREVFPKSNNNKDYHNRPHDQDPTISTISTQGENPIKHIVEKVKAEILRELLCVGTCGDSKSSLAQKEDSLEAKQAMKPRKSDNKRAMRKLYGDGQNLQDAGTLEVTIEKKEGAGTSNIISLPAHEEDNLVAVQVRNLTMTTQNNGPSNKNKVQGTSELGDQDQNLIDAIVQETKEKMEQLKRKINEQLKNRMIVYMIKEFLNNESVVVILKIDNITMTHGFPWAEIRNALSFSKCIDGAVIITGPSDTQKEYCYPQEQEPINYSLVGLYHDYILRHSSQKNHGMIIRDILEKCKHHELSMKVFSHALYANPKRRYEDLEKLYNTLQKVSSNYPTIIAKKVFKFSYNDMPKEYKSSLLYLAIFPPEYKIRRSALTGRWVVEGLISTEDWVWTNSIRKAEKCFDTLIRRFLIYPSDIGASGKVKSCMVDKQIHDLITNIAEKQHIMEARLSHHLARHFSIYNDLRLRGSDTIIDFFEKLSKSSPLLKVLDLQGCKCFSGRNIWFLKEICNKILLLKYLSLRGTDVAHLPSEINNLQELEVLDIRQTKVPVKATRIVRLLKLKHLLAGYTVSSLSCINVLTSVQVPEKVENMEHMEVLSNVRALSSQDVRDIGTLWRLRKLGLVIEDKVSHLSNLLVVISNLHKCLRSLSITLQPTIGRVGTPHIKGFSYFQSATSRISQRTTSVNYELKDPPKLLESLSICGTTTEVHLLEKLLDKDVKELTKVSLSDTLLRKEDLEALAMLPKLHSFRLQNVLCTERKLTFNNNEFPSLKYFLFEGDCINDIGFEVGGKHGLDEIVLSFNSYSPTNTKEHESNKSTITGTSTMTSRDFPKLVKHEPNNNNTSTNIMTAEVFPKQVEHKPNNNTTSTNTNIATTYTGADRLQTQEHQESKKKNTIIDVTTKVSGLPKLQQELKNKDTMLATTTITTIDSLPKQEKQKSNNNNATIKTPSVLSASTSTTIGVHELPKQKKHEQLTTVANNMLHSLFDNNNAKQITKITLRGTMLKDGDLQNLVKKPELRCLVLLEKSYVETKLTFNKDEFPKLKLLIVNCSNINEINFTRKSAPKLQKIIWTFTKDKVNYYSLFGIDNLPKLKEFEFNGDAIPHSMKECLDKHRNKIVPKINKSENQNQEIENNKQIKGEFACFPFYRKNQT